MLIKKRTTPLPIGAAYSNKEAYKVFENELGAVEFCKLSGIDLTPFVVGFDDGDPFPSFEYAYEEAHARYVQTGRRQLVLLKFGEHLHNRHTLYDGVDVCSLDPLAPELTILRGGFYMAKPGMAGFSGVTLQASDDPVLNLDRTLAGAEEGDLKVYIRNSIVQHLGSHKALHVRGVYPSKNVWAYAFESQVWNDDGVVEQAYVEDAYIVSRNTVFAGLEASVNDLAAKIGSWGFFTIEGGGFTGSVEFSGTNGYFFGNQFDMVVQDNAVILPAGNSMDIGSARIYCGNGVGFTGAGNLNYASLIKRNEWSISPSLTVTTQEHLDGFSPSDPDDWCDPPPDNAPAALDYLAAMYEALEARVAALEE